MKAERERREEERIRKEEESEIKRKEERERKLEELKKAKEVEQKKKQEEYDQWQHLFEVDEEGEAQSLDDNGSASLLQSFISHVKQCKVVVLEDLAAHFKLKTEQVIERLKSHEEQGAITGLFDDRGKFIYLTEDELQAVARFIEVRGRVAINELCRGTQIFKFSTKFSFLLESNKLINLKPMHLAVSDPVAADQQQVE